MLHAEFLSSIADLDPVIWDALFQSDNPFIRHEFLAALEESGCVSAESGWQPQHLVMFSEVKAVAAMPLYIKSHSYGEFVFDWGWAEAYQRHGLEYYPKLLTAIPFTPSTGPRAGFAAGEDAELLLTEMIAAIRDRARQLGCSGWHLLFPDQKLVQATNFAGQAGILQRRDLQFHWINRDYGSFDDYLSVLRSSRRKTLRRERRLVAEQGIVVHRKTGAEIKSADCAAFYQCYTATYLKRSGHPGYLSQEFFERLLQTMRETMMLVLAEQEGDIVASSLFFYDSQKLYGRYWGALADINCMHFEACFYQGIEFCIEYGLSSFDPGTQGEHKLLRGFEPFETCSFHWIADPRFSTAIDHFLQQETRGTSAYVERAAAFLPFKSEEHQKG